MSDDYKSKYESMKSERDNAIRARDDHFRNSVRLAELSVILSNNNKSDKTIRVRIVSSNPWSDIDKIVLMNYVPNKGDYFNIDGTPIAKEVQCVTHYVNNDTFDVLVMLSM